MANPAADTANKGTLTRDPELAAMDKAVKLFGGLEPEARRRVLRFVNERFDDRPQIPPPTKE